MNHIIKRDDGQYELTLPSGRVAIAERIETLEHLQKAHAGHIEGKVAFLEAWKTGVKLAGPGWFEVKSAAVVEALNIDDLRPNWDLIEAQAGGLSHGERVFLYALCSFFNDQWGRELFAKFDETGHPCELAAILDGERREVIAQLLIHYSGW